MSRLWYVPNVSGRIFRQYLVEFEDERVRDDVNEVGATGGRPPQQGNVGRVGQSLVRGGDTDRRVQQLTGNAPLHLLLRRGLGQRSENRQERGFHDQAVGFGGTFLAHDHPARRRFGVRRDAKLLHRRGIEHGPVQGYVPDQHRVVREVRVEVFAMQCASIGHDRLVISVGHDDLAVGDVARVPELLELRDNRLDICRRAGWRCEHVDLVGHRQCIDVVAVRVDESR